MDYNELVREIVAQVMKELGGTAPQAERKQKFFVVTPKHGQRCHAFLESRELNARYDMVCAMSANYECELEGSAGVAVFGLSNTDLARLHSGICDTPFTALISKALLMGLSVYTVSEEIEILSRGYKTKYASAFLDKLKALEGWGLTVCSWSELEMRVLGSAAGAAGGSVECAGKLITERDVIAARDAGARVIYTAEKAIITDLARERAKRSGIEFSAR